MDMTPEQMAKAVETVSELKAAEKQDLIARFLGMKLEKLSPGCARVSMKLRPEYLSFNGVVFGAIIAAVADQAFAYGSNSVAHPSVASQFNICFLGAPSVSDELTAECQVVKNGRRVGISEITVTNQDGRLIAKATGTTIPVG